MALLFSDGFDHYETADILKKWTTATNWTPTFATLTDGIYTGYARPPGGQGLHLGAGNHALTKSLASSYATLIGGANVYWETFGGVVLGFLDSGTNQVDVRSDGSGHLTVTRNGTVLATSTNTISLNTWYHVEFKATINPTTGAYELRVNGSSTGWVPAATGANTRNSANSTANQFRLGSDAASDAKRYDDSYVLDTSGSVANDFIGAQKIITIYPSAAGNYTQWTGNYASNFANVNESTGDGDGTFNQSSTAGQIDTFGFDDVPSGTISAVQHVLMARQDAGAARTVRAKQRTSGTDYNGTTQSTAGSYQFLTDAKSTNPATSAAWTASDVNGAEFGYELVS